MAEEDEQHPRIIWDNGSEMAVGGTDDTNRLRGFDEMTMSEEWLATFRQALDDAVLMRTGRSIGDLASDQVVEDLMPMLQPLLEITEAVAKRTEVWRNGCEENALECPFCESHEEAPYDPKQGVDAIHTPDCPVTQARALLGKGE